MNTKIITSLLLTGVLLSLPAYAETFRCNGKIIERGTPQDKVLELCGPPSNENHQSTNYWVYKHHSGSHDVRVYFYANGDVERIESTND